MDMRTELKLKCCCLDGSGEILKSDVCKKKKLEHVYCCFCKLVKVQILKEHIWPRLHSGCCSNS